MGVDALAGGGIFPALTAGDFDGDGRVDLAASGAGVTVLFGNGDGTFRVGADYESGSYPDAILARDFNGDGTADLMTAFANDGTLGGIHVRLGNGDGTFGDALLSVGQVAVVPVLSAADFDASGTADLAMVMPYSDRFGVLLGNGDGTFQAPIDVSVVGSSVRVAVHSADFNGDDKPDLALREYGTDGVVVLLGRGDGTFPSQGGVSSPSDAAPGLAIGDFNGDGALDAAVANVVRDDRGNHVGCRAETLLGAGDGTFQSGADVQSDVAFCSNLSAGDFDGDARIDLAIVGEKTTLLFGKGDGTFGRTASYTGIGLPELNGVAVEDFDGDGRSDLAIASTGGLQIILGRTVQ